MSEQLKARLEVLRKEIAGTRGDTRLELLEHLEQAVHGLEGVGEEIPAWAREMVEKAHEADVEDGFDNMPV
ncbi:hypothetical protein [Maliponia aquimaris]|uniref:Uncharacterized protein n=1 Tax=Maliponia aquimaris TaxID=1673631 RepID=A0A238L4L4_9RHOB|nr:hypothetical protein [Maliponia aquimaris]SMX49937.1 hypothetical protein MAA8898_04524 [Maliponia aquimaris]